MKKLFTGALALLMLMSLVGCSKPNTPTEIDKEKETEIKETESKVYKLTVPSENEDTVIYVNIEEVGDKEIVADFGSDVEVSGDVDYKTAGTYYLDVTKGSDTICYEVIVGDTATIEADKTKRAERRAEIEAQKIPEDYKYPASYSVVIDGVEWTPDNIHTIDIETAKKYITMVFGVEYEVEDGIVFAIPKPEWTCVEWTYLANVYLKGGKMSVGNLPSIDDTMEKIVSCGI